MLLRSKKMVEIGAAKYSLKRLTMMGWQEQAKCMIKVAQQHCDALNMIRQLQGCIGCHLQENATQLFKNNVIKILLFVARFPSQCHFNIVQLQNLNLEELYANIHNTAYNYTYAFPLVYFNSQASRVIRSFERVEVLCGVINVLPGAEQ